MNQPDKQLTIFNGNSRLLALFGKDLSYSRSPELHNSWIRDHGMNACYLPIEWNSADDFLLGIQAMTKSKSFLGANITNPFKSVVTTSGFFESDERVLAIGAANTLFRKETKWILTNTDVDGIGATVTQGTKEFTNKEWDVIILGGGGAAAAAAFTFTTTFRNCRVRCALRNPSKAHTFLISAGIHQLILPGDQTLDEDDAGGRLFDQLAITQTGRSRLLINATPLGQKNESNPMANVLIRHWLAPQGSASFYFDMAYGENPALQLANDLQVPHSNGMTMLTAQAARSFAIWKDSLGPDL